MTIENKPLDANDPTNSQPEKEDKKPARRRTKRRYVIGFLLGATIGLAYYSFIGCQSGGCPITSSPVISTIYGAVMGTLAAGV